jgi:hypothetical protein
VNVLGLNAFAFSWLAVLGLTAAAVAAAAGVFGLMARWATNVRRAFTTVALLTLLASFVPNALSIAGVGATSANVRGRAAATAGANANAATSEGANGASRRSGATGTARLPTQGMAMLMHVTTCAVSVPLLLGTLRMPKRRAASREDDPTDKEQA